MGRLTMSNNKSLIYTQDEINKQIELARMRATAKEPRPLSIVRFADNSSFRKMINDEYLSGISTVSMNDYQNLLYLGSIPNQSGHGVYVNLRNDTIHVIDIDELVEVEEE